MPYRTRAIENPNPMIDPLAAKGKLTRSPCVLVGLDCSTEDSRISVALGEYHDGNIRVTEVQICARERSAVSIVAKWLTGVTDALLAIDAPLGWPASSARALSGHKAADALAVMPNDLFRRETDRFISERAGRLLSTWARTASLARRMPPWHCWGVAPGDGFARRSCLEP
jgi:hypothetical protein